MHSIELLSPPFARSPDQQEKPRTFSLQYEGMLPLGGRGTQVSRIERTRMLRGMVQQLEPCESLLFCYSRDEHGSLSWRVAGTSQRHLEDMVQATLGGLRRSYRFIQAGPEPASLNWSTEIRPTSKSLRAAAQGLGFNAAPVEMPPLRLPHPKIGCGDRTFNSLVQLVLGASHRLTLRVQCEALTLTPEQRQCLGDSLETLQRAGSDTVGRAHNDGTCELLRAWLADGHGFRLRCHVEAVNPVSAAMLRMIGHEVFGCPVEEASSEEAAGSCFDLSNALPAHLALPSLLPSAEALAEARPKRVFNVHLPRLPAEGPSLGIATSGTHSASVVLPADGRSRHTYIVGATGTGKSTLLGNLIQQDIAAGHGMALIDPHGDLFEHVLATLPARRAKDVVLIEPASSDRVPGINFLDIPEGPLRRLQVNFVVTEFMSMFNQLYNMRECGGPQFELYFRNSMLLLIESRCPDATILDLARVFNDKEFRKQLCEHCKDKQVVSFWTQTAERTSGDHSLANFTPYITSKLNQLTQSGPIRPIIGQAHTTIDFRKLMDNRGILLVNLSKGLLGEMDTRLLGMVLIGQLFSAALGRATLPHNKRMPFHLVVDEFQNFVTDSVAALVAEARKFGLQLTLANQTLAQLTANRGQQNLLEAILGNVGNMIAFRLGVPDAERLALFTEPDLPRQELQRLPNFHAFARLLTAEGPVDPFVFKSSPPAKSSCHAQRVLVKVREHQLKWAHPLEEVERDIARRLNASRWEERQTLVNVLAVRASQLS